VGGVSGKCSQIGEDFYTRVLDFDPRDDLDRKNGVWVLDSCESAEFVKLAETTYRDVNIGLANQFAKFADKLNLNIYDVIDASNSQPYSHIHQPGIAVGGHCIPIYPQFYVWGDPDATIVKAARENNAQMPNYVVSQVDKLLKLSEHKRVLVLGASYRDKVKELAFSGVFAIQRELSNLGYQVEVFDPLFSNEELTFHGIIPQTSDTEDFGAVIVQNSSEEFKKLFQETNDWINLVAIFDGRNLFGGKSPLYGIPLYGIGVKDSRR
jgi:nucleotide sugar dehydrogenase